MRDIMPYRPVRPLFEHRRNGCITRVMHPFGARSHWVVRHDALMTESLGEIAGNPRIRVGPLAKTIAVLVFAKLVFTTDGCLDPDVRRLLFDLISVLISENDYRIDYRSWIQQVGRA